MKVRIEIHLTVDEVKVLDAIAKSNSRSRKNFCETEIRKIIEVHIKSLATQINT